MLCAEYGKGRITQTLTLTASSGSEKPLATAAYPVAGSGAVVALAKGLAVDLTPVRVNCISPGLIATELHEVRLRYCAVSRSIQS
jgi:NAD(P)-dependent dehydrogenase (short-subunit alcohol dehydrogenase family)